MTPVMLEAWAKEHETMARHIIQNSPERGRRPRDDYILDLL